MATFSRIKVRDSKQYADNGHFVLQNVSRTQAQVTDEGVYLKAGDTCAVDALDDSAQKSIDRGLVRLVARPAGSQDGAKKNKKKTEDPAPVIAENAKPEPVEEAPAAASEPSVEPVAEVVSENASEQSPEAAPSEESIF